MNTIMFEKLGKIWKDPVFSKLIAEALKWVFVALILPIFIFLFNFSTALLNELGFRASWSATVTKTTYFFSQSINISIATFIFIFLCFVLMVYFCRYLLASRKVNQIKNYKAGIFWGSIIKWKWERKDGKLQVKDGDFEIICPNSSHNLVLEYNNGYFFLKCSQCGFKSIPYHYESPDGISMASLAQHYFYIELTSLIDAELRNKKLK